MVSLIWGILIYLYWPHGGCMNPVLNGEMHPLIVLNTNVRYGELFSLFSDC